jgi:hypothetical protein
MSAKRKRSSSPVPASEPEQEVASNSSVITPPGHRFEDRDNRAVKIRRGEGSKGAKTGRNITQGKKKKKSKKPSENTAAPDTSVADPVMYDTAASEDVPDPIISNHTMALAPSRTELKQAYDDIEARRLDAIQKWEANGCRRHKLKKEVWLLAETSEDAKALAAYAGTSKKNRKRVCKEAEKIQKSEVREEEHRQREGKKKEDAMNDWLLQSDEEAVVA